MSSDEYCECHNVIIFELKFYLTSSHIFHEKKTQMFRQLGENYRNFRDSYFKGFSTSNQAQLKWRRFHWSLYIYAKNMMCARIFRIFYFHMKLNVFVCKLFFLSHFVWILSPTQFAIMGMLNMVTMEHMDGTALPRYAMAQCTMYIRFTLTLICWICMFGILLGFYNIIMHTPFLLGLRCHYTNVGSVPEQILNELMIACMLMFM